LRFPNDGLSKNFELYLTENNFEWIKELWINCDMVVSCVVQMRQNGLENICLLPNCNLKCSASENMYKCEAGHESKECQVEDKMSYEKILELIDERFSFLMSLNISTASFKNVGIHSNVLQNALLPIETETIRAIIKFSLESDLNLSFFSTVLSATKKKANLRRDGLSSFASLIKKVSFLI
jgi:hypothetical protein